MTKYYPPGTKMKVGELHPGDVIKQMDSEWGTAIVEQVSATEVRLFRPYGTTAGFVYSDGRTICYTGMEHTTFPRGSATEFEIYRREHEEV
jgi:hypothetical protein